MPFAAQAERQAAVAQKALARAFWNTDITSMRKVLAAYAHMARPAQNKSTS